ncbi:MAG: sigma-54 factor interaction domain-containing protein [Bacteroidetes bacterium]|nr:sigma-54 factor interaction domain-containing protein [Bacteroidota bacterium]
MSWRTGVGKEIFAEYIHKTSSRSQNTFVKISLSAMPPDLLESELFGHVKGAFTSATSEKKSLFEIADCGSMFLDDIDDIPLSIQPKLLRVLEYREIMRVGSTSSIPREIHGSNPLQVLIKSCRRCFIDDSMSYEQVISYLNTIF